MSIGNNPIAVVSPAEILNFWEGGNPSKSYLIKYVTVEKDSNNHILQVTIERIKVNEALIIPESDVARPHLILINCEVSKCVFLKADLRDLTFQDSTIGNLDIKTSTVEDILIENSVIGNIKITGKSELGNLRLMAKSKIKNLSILSSKCKSIYIEDSQSDAIKIDNSLVKSTQNKNIIEFIKIDKSTIGLFELLNDVRANSVQIQESATKDIYLEKSQIRSILIKSAKTGSFKIKSSEIEEHIRIEYSDLKSLWTAGESKIGDFKIIKSNLEYFSITSTHIKDFYFSRSITAHITISHKSIVERFRCFLFLQEPTQVILNNSEIIHLDLNESVVPEFATYKISGCTIKNLSISDFCNFGSIFFNKIQVKDEKSVLCFCGSDLGKMQFINCDLTEFERFEFSNTKMLDVFVAGSKMPEVEKFYLPPNITGDIAEQKRLAYGQFKKIYEAQGDTAGSLRYLAYEMDAYRAQLNREGKEKKLAIAQKWDNRGERFILWLNKHSTNYGNNWLKGAVSTLCIACFLFAVYCFSVGYRPGSDVCTFLDLASHSLEYLNPFRDEDSGELFKTFERDGMKIHWYSRLWDYFSRIVVAYFVYQTIQAFRKLGKSSG